MAGLHDGRREGLRAARHLPGEIYEVGADGRDVIYRILFAEQGNKGRPRPTALTRLGRPV